MTTIKKKKKKKKIKIKCEKKKKPNQATTTFFPLLLEKGFGLLGVQMPKGKYAIFGVD